MLNAQPGPDLNNPEKAFARPHAIVEARDLTRGQKEHALNCWQRVVEDRVTSSSASERDRTLLKEIDRARKAIAALFASARGASGVPGALIGERNLCVPLGERKKQEP